jgi:hypothetical protein
MSTYIVVKSIATKPATKPATPSSLPVITFTSLVSR